MWGRTILDKEGADVAEEVTKAFSCKPCLGNKESLSPFAYNMCLQWTRERYGGPSSLTPALCQACKESSLQIKAEESTHTTEVEKHLIEPKAESDFGSICQSETDLENSMEGYLDAEEEKFSQESANNLLDDLEEGGYGKVWKDKGRYVCKICNKIYKGMRSFLSHGGHKEKKCTECEEHFSSLSLLKAHCVSVNHALRYKCDYCDEVFKDTRNRTEHVNTDHKVPTILKVQTVQHTKRHQKPVQYNCPLCHETFGPDKYGCWGHLRSAHREESVGCEAESCRYACVGKPMMFLHTLSAHSDKDKTHTSHHQRLQDVAHTCTTG